MSKSAPAVIEEFLSKSQTGSAAVYYGAQWAEYLIAALEAAGFYICRMDGGVHAGSCPTCGCVVSVHPAAAERIRLFPGVLTEDERANVRAARAEWLRANGFPPHA